MITTKQNSTFKKTAVSIIVISLITGGFMMLERQQREKVIQAPIDPRFISSMQSTDLHEMEKEAQALLISEQEIELTLQQYSDEEVVMAVEEEKVEPPILQRIEPIVIKNKLLFAFDSTEIEASYFHSLNETAKQMISADKQQLWQVVGYADQNGNATYNKKLAQKRAAAVALFLVDKGVDESQLVTLSLGDSQPQQHVFNKENNRLDRRVEIHAYQAEVTALAKQLNKPVKRKVSLLPKESVSASLSVNSTASSSLNEQAKVLPVISFASLPEHLSTAMQF